MNFRHPDLSYQRSKYNAELDIYIPKLSLAFEYQGESHYKTDVRYGNHKLRQSRDEEKKRLCFSSGITMIQVPYWWDDMTSSIAATILSIRPDIQLSEKIKPGKPIPASPSTMISSTYFL
jgi:hypothetical protein